MSDELKTTEEHSSKPARERFTDPKALKSLYDLFTQEDSKEARRRSLIRRVYDGNQPFDPAKLRAAGHANLTNINFLGLKGLIDSRSDVILKLSSDTADLIELLPRARELAGPDAARVADVIAGEFSSMLRTRGKIVPALSRMNKEADLYGLGPITWPNDEDYLPIALERGQVRFDPEGPLLSSDHDIIMFESTLPAAYAFSLLDNPGDAGRNGWNVAKLKEWVQKVFYDKHATEAQPGVTSGTTTREEYDTRVRQNRLCELHQFERLHVIHAYVREMAAPRKITHYMMPAAELDAFLFKKKNAYDSMDDVFMWFAYSESERYARGLRGLGSFMLGPDMLRNRLLCSVYDTALRSGSLLLQRKGVSSSSVTVDENGPYIAISADAVPVQNQMSQSLDKVMALIDFTDKQAVLSSTGKHSAPLEGGTQTGLAGDRMTKEQVKQMTRDQSRKDEMLFIQRIIVFDRVFQQTYKRFINILKHRKDDNYPEIKDFLERCEMRGVTRDMIVQSVRLFSVVTNRDLVLGSEGKVGVLTELLTQFGGTLDEPGRKAAVRDIVRLRLGDKDADRYSPEGGRDTQPSDAQSFATLENNMITEGRQVMVGPDQLHWSHIPVHAQLLQMVTEQVRNGMPEAGGEDVAPQVDDPERLMQILQAASGHIQEHVRIGGMQIGMQPAAEQVMAMIRGLMPTIKALNLAIATQRRVREAQEEKAQREMQELQQRADQNEQQVKLAEIQKDADIARYREDKLHEARMAGVHYRAEEDRLRGDSEREHAARRMENERMLAETSAASRMMDAKSRAAEKQASLENEDLALGNLPAPQPREFTGDIQMGTPLDLEM